MAMNTQITNMTANEIDEILELQKTVYDALGKSQKAFILPKSSTFLKELFASGGTMIGVRSEGKLIAQSMVVNPNSRHPDTGMVDMPFSAPPEMISVFQGVIVHPDMRGHHLGAMMCKHWVEACQHNGRRHLMAETALTNIASQKIFFSHNMPAVSVGTDPVDGTVVCNHYCDLKNLKKIFNQAAETTVAINDEKKIRALLNDGYVGYGHESRYGVFHFRMAKA
jgi:hypothetical protein